MENIFYEAIIALVNVKDYGIFNKWKKIMSELHKLRFNTIVFIQLLYQFNTFFIKVSYNNTAYVLHALIYLPYFRK